MDPHSHQVAAVTWLMPCLFACLYAPSSALQCFIGEVRHDNANDEVLYLRRLLDREAKDRKEAQELLDQERAKCALLEQEISSAAQAAREMGESLRMYFSQSGSDASSDGRLRAICGAAIPQVLPPTNSATDSSSQLADLHWPDSQQQLKDAYPPPDQSADTVGPHISSPRSNKHGYYKGRIHGGDNHQIMQSRRWMQHKLGASCTSSSVHLSTANSAEFSPLLSSQSKLGAGSKRMQQHVLQVADQLQHLAMGWKQRLDEFQPALDSAVGVLTEEKSTAKPPPVPIKACLTYNPVFDEEQAATRGVDNRKSRLRPADTARHTSPAAATDQAHHSGIALSAGPQLAARDSCTISDCSSTAVPRHPVPQAVQSVLSNADSFPTPPMSVVQSNSHQNSTSHTAGAPAYLRASVASAVTEEWSSRSSSGFHGSSNTTLAQDANDINSSTGSWHGIGRYRGSWQKPAVRETVAEESELEAEQAEQHHDYEEDDRVESGSPIAGAVSNVTLADESEEESELSEPEQFPNVEYSRPVERMESWPQHIQQAQVASPLSAWTTGSPASTITPGCAITRGAVPSKGSPAVQLIGRSPNQPAFSASASGGSSAMAHLAVPATPQGVQQQQHTKQQQLQVESIPRELRSMAPLKRHQHYLSSSQMSLASPRV